MSAQLPPEIRESLDELKGITDDFLQKNDERFAGIRSRISDLEMHRNRQGLGGSWPGDGDRAELNKALRIYLKTGNDSLLREKAMSVGSDPQGGYFLNEPLAKTITSTIFNSSPISQVARTVEISSDAFEELIDKDEPAASWVSETESRIETTSPEIGRLRIPAHEIYAAPRCTQKLLDDSSIDLAGWLSQKIGDKFSRAEGTAFISGDGVGRPRGFLTYPTAATGDATRAWGTVEHIATGVNGGFHATLPGDALISAIYKLKAGYRGGSVWAMNSATIAATRKLKDVDLRYLWQTSVIAGQPDLLLGYPVIACEDMPDIATNSLSIAFGNFARSYTIADRLPMRAIRDELTAKPFVIFYVTRRVGGDLVNTESLKFIKFSTS